MKVFLGGPIQHAVDPNGFDVRLRYLLLSVNKTLESNRVPVFSAHIAEDFGGYDALGKEDMIAKRDFDWIQECDVYVAVLPAGQDGKLYRSDGTFVELGWASALRKPIILISCNQTAHSVLVQGLGTLSPVRYMSLEDLETSPSSLIEVLHTLKSSD
jgi:nucleoside 2-deoxyribosyltransferase